ncbi:hypothetical protein QAD02_001207 [Eretmocerus hayati]|uniref:Uncharacterized protein n=1 Tax=Eretmocerus hayati TaxID=131215 RepID=A0ACC2NGL6_9HYME|nr:hypothetical protein QAD02_001207 [Eretmocerus hayati]
MDSTLCSCRIRANLIHVDNERSFGLSCCCAKSIQLGGSHNRPSDILVLVNDVLGQEGDLRPHRDEDRGHVSVNAGPIVQKIEQAQIDAVKTIDYWQRYSGIGSVYNEDFEPPAHPGVGAEEAFEYNEKIDWPAEDFIGVDDEFLADSQNHISVNGFKPSFPYYRKL